jgi:hypothetical protein
MKKKRTLKKYLGKWVLLDKENRVIYASDNVADVVEKGREYPYNEVSIGKKLDPGSCFF